MRSTGFLGRTAALLLAVAAMGCAQLSEDMRLAEVEYETARYENALVWLDDVEDQTPDMDVATRARYFYLRGMTSLRLNQRTEALHYLALAREVGGDQGTGLKPEWRTTLASSLEELTPVGQTHRARSAPEE